MVKKKRKTYIIEICLKNTENNLKFCQDSMIQNINQESQNIYCMIILKDYCKLP